MKIDEMPIIEVPPEFIDALIQVGKNVGGWDQLIQTEDAEHNIYATFKGFRLKPCNMFTI